MDEYDLMTQAAELQRRRKVQEALQQRSAAAYERAAGGKGDILDALLGWKTGRDATSENSKLLPDEQSHRERYNSRLADETNVFLETSQGRAADPMPADGVGPVRPGEAANPRRAVIQAMTSQLPEMQQLGKTAFSTLGKPAEITEHLVDGQVVAGPKGGPKTVQFGEKKPVDEFGPLVVLGKDGKGAPIMGQRNARTGELKYAPGGGQTINVSATTAAQKQGLGEWSKNAAETVKELTTTARSSVKLLGQLNQVEKLSQDGTFNGPTANGAVWLGQLFGAAGVPMSPDTKRKLQNSETFGNTAAELWLSTMNANGGSRGLVKEESERIAANLPALIQTPAGRQQMVQVLRQAAQQNIEDAQNANMQYAKALQAQDPGLFTFGLINTTLPNTMPTEPAPRSSTAPGAPKLSGKW